MKWLRHFELFRESKEYSTKNLIVELCVAMVLINNEFLDKILDQGIKSRYSENSQVFLTDLKSLLLAKNRLHLGKFVDGKCVADDEISKVNTLFDSVEFNIEDDWNKLISARNIARSIIDKLIPDEKLISDRISAVYWIGPNEMKDFDEDIVLETTDGGQYGFHLNKNASSQKSASFNLFADDIIGGNIDSLFKGEYLMKWNKLTEQWIKIIYENANKNIQQHIEKFIEAGQIGNIGYFEYFDIRHKDPRFKHLGEFINEFDKNILKFPDLMNEIWKNRDTCFVDPGLVYREWMKNKIYILNSRILEHIFTNSLKSNNSEDIVKLEDGFKMANGPVKMKLFKTIVEKMDCSERPIYYVGKNGDTFSQIPSREFFRKYYNDLDIKFDYHVKFITSEEEEDNDFNIKLVLSLEDDILLNMNIIIKFSGEMSGKLSAKYRYELSDHFNYIVSKKMNGESNS
jgi:ssDNA-specific exonuclease RecJ